MIDPNNLEQVYQHYIADLVGHAPDGIFEVDLQLLHDLDLLAEEDEKPEEDDFLNESFYVIESDEKLTLFNQKYVVWIVPQILENQPVTTTLIALQEQALPRLEMVFTTSGVYNNSGLVLRILERFLHEIDENEEEILRFKPH